MTASPAPDPGLPDVTSVQYVNTLVHFYRGELGRMMSWRQRFDATTNWSIVATGSLTAFAVGTPEMTSQVMLINLFVLGFFSFIEARRYRFYDAFRARARMLEVHFIAPALLPGNGPPLDSRWREQLTRDLLTPRFKCSFAFALGRRFRHLYFALHLFVLASWAGLLAGHAPDLRSWYGAFHVGPLPPAAVLGLVGVWLGGLTWAIVGSGSLRGSASEMDEPDRATQWPTATDAP